MENPKDMSNTFSSHFASSATDPPSIDENCKEEKEELPHDILQYVKERDAIKKTLDIKELALQTSQARVYDLTKQIEGMEAQMKILTAEKSTKGGGSQAGTPKTSPSRSIFSGSLVSPIRPRTGGKKKGRRKDSSIVSMISDGGVDSSRTRDIGSSFSFQTSIAEKNSSRSNRRHPVILGMEDLVEDDYLYYTEIGERYPHIKLSVLLEAERKFSAADADESGTIDLDELEKILDNNHIMFTKSQVNDILKEIDADKTGTLDFLEVLEILQKIDQNRKTNLPNSLKQVSSKVCIVQ